MVNKTMQLKIRQTRLVNLTFLFTWWNDDKKYSWHFIPMRNVSLSFSSPVSLQLYLKKKDSTWGSLHFVYSICTRCKSLLIILRHVNKSMCPFSLCLCAFSQILFSSLPPCLPPFLCLSFSTKGSLWTVAREKKGGNVSSQLVSHYNLRYRWAASY